jgi:acetyl-CoA C-acetyltransferase
MAAPQLDPRTPVIVGVGQLSNRVDRGSAEASPVELIVEAGRRAADDAGAADIVTALDVVRVVGLVSWRYRDPARLVADRLGSPRARSGLSAFGGNSPQGLINVTAEQIQAGDLDATLVCGGEAWRTRKDFIRREVRPDWSVQSVDVAPDERFGVELTMHHDAETAIGLIAPAHMYALFDHAVRIAAGRSVGEQQALIGGLWSRFSAVAAGNPHAWKSDALAPEAIMDPAGGNRVIAHPYPKAVNSYEWVDQAAALLICSAGRAEDLGIARERWVFPLAGASASEPPVSVRRDLHRSASMAAAGRAVLNASDLHVDDLDIIDLYSCFPSAVQIAAAELGLDLARELTVTGGMSFFGGPWNDYVTHSVATTVERLRESDNGRALCTANGGMTQKQAFGIYSTHPPSDGFRHLTDEPQAEVDAVALRDVLTDHRGQATIEAFTVLHDRSGAPERAIASALTADGARAWAASTDESVMAALMAGDLDRAEVDIAAGELTPAG